MEVSNHPFPVEFNQERLCFAGMRRALPRMAKRLSSRDPFIACARRRAGRSWRTRPAALPAL
jgi:hypothetical protein